MKRRKKAKVLSFLLCIFIIFTTFTPMPIRASEEDEGNNKNVIVTQAGKTVISAPDNMTGELQWQYYSDEYNMWINIHGENGDTCTLTYAKVYNMLDDNGQTQVRCIQTIGETEITSDTFTVTLDTKQQEVDKVTEVSKEKVEVDTIVANTMVDNFAIATASFEDDDVSDIQTYNDIESIENGDTENKTYSVVINYVFENNEIAADPYTATLAAGSNFSATVNNPIIQGYLPYIGNGTETSASVELNYTNIQNDDTITVTYKPTNVNYTVIHYKQNIDNDNYTVFETEIKQGLTKSIVPEVSKIYKDYNGNTVYEDENYKGFYNLLYEKPEIAADGSTVVEVYYDRYYYLMNFDLDGGYGVEPIYARYGATIINVEIPTKAGYTFKSWSLDGTTTVELPRTMPAENCIYKAIWEMDETAKVTIVFWGENADDEKYSYIHSSIVNVKPGTEFTYSENGSLICRTEIHSHSATCGYNCRLEEHSHIEDCYICGVSSHTHGISCYDGVGDASSAGLNAPSNPSNGYIARRAWSRDGKVIYINGKWYRYTGETEVGSIASSICGNTEGTHTHTDECLGCDKTAHTHSSECGYNCGKKEHTHNSDCYMGGAGLDSDLWKFVKSDTVTIAADGSTVVNVYYNRTTFTLTFRANRSTVATITDKWGADISDEFNKAPFNTTYSGRAWECTDDSKYSYALQTLDRMPKFNATFDLYSKSSNTMKTIYYYVEKVGSNVSDSIWPTSTDNFELLKQVGTYFNYATYDEEYHEIEGFTRYSESVSGFSGNRKDFSNNKLYLYYLRKSYTLVFNDGYSEVKTETVEYQESLSKYESYEPELPSAYEKGSHVFAGWYLNPQCTGDEYKLSEHTMPLGNLILYAKWVPVTHKVEFYLTQDDMESGRKIGDTHPDLTAQHGNKVAKVIENPTNGSYTFIGWFYMDGNTEKAFDFENMPINKDMKVYGKWSSNVLKNYFIYYKIQGEGTEIADPTTGSALAGSTKTFEAKGGTDLKPTYQVGYFPIVKSHSLTIDIENEDKNSFTFWYVQKDAVPYTVKYINAETGEPVATEKIVSDNRKAVVTETFVPVEGMMPDAYQKRLVVSAEDNAVNEIIFYYTEDTVHAYYKITHYTENPVKDSDGKQIWTEYASSQAIGDINKIYSAEPLEIDGFTYDPNVEGTVVSGTLTANGLELKLYYVRNEYPYQVRYLEKGSGKQLADPKNGIGKYGQVISEDAVDIKHYKSVDPTSQTLTIKIEEGTDAKLNVITFYYEESEVDLTIIKSGADNIDENQSFIFNIKGDSEDSLTKGIDLTVTIVGNGSVTIKDLPVGTYTITEDSDWSWRYSTNSSYENIEITANREIEFKNIRDDYKWLNGNAYKDNKFHKKVE